MFVRCAVIAAVATLSSYSQTIPPGIAGDWTASEVRSTQFKDRSTGSFSGPTGTIVTYHISEDGQYTQETLIQTSMYNCTNTVFVAEWGRVGISGSKLLFESAGGKLNSQDNCNARFNYIKRIEPKVHTYAPWLLRNAPSGQEFCMTDAQQRHTCYRRKN